MTLKAIFQQYRVMIFYRVQEFDFIITALNASFWKIQMRIFIES